ncbi:MAG: hypothetical protein J6S14_11945 [Clostridia bacterium]|nr:hypothetical protein [Clostridia bacterium]
MILSFATKRDAYGLRKWLVVDLDRCEYATDCRRFSDCRENFVEVKDTDRKKIRDRFIMAGYSHVDYCKEA